MSTSNLEPSHAVHRSVHALRVKPAFRASCLCAAVLVISGCESRAGEFATSFEAAFPSPARVAGSAFVDTVGGVGGSGVLKITTAANNLQGAFIIDDFDAAAPVYGFEATFKMRMGGGTPVPADGASFCWAEDLPTGASWGEEGTGTGLIVAFDTYDSGGGEAPAVDIKLGGVMLATRPVPIALLRTGLNFVDVRIALSTSGTLDVIYGETVFYENFPVPGFTSFSGAHFGIGARTGGLNENHFVDDLRIQTVVPEPSTIALSVLGAAALLFARRLPASNRIGRSADKNEANRE